MPEGNRHTLYSGPSTLLPLCSRPLWPSCFTLRFAYVTHTWQQHYYFSHVRIIIQTFFAVFWNISLLVPHCLLMVPKYLLKRFRPMKGSSWWSGRYVSHTKDKRYQCQKYRNNMTLQSRCTNRINVLSLPTPTYSVYAIVILLSWLMILRAPVACRWHLWLRHCSRIRKH